jgi:FlaA1/EpsC-like NDP-sugar epimerase
VVRIFNSYVPLRAIFLLFGEVAAVCLSFTLAIVISFGGESRAVFANQQAILKILAVVALTFLCSHYLELHDLRRLKNQSEIHSRILMLVGTLSFILAALSYLYPQFKVGRYVFLTGLLILAIAWTSWRWAYVRLISLRGLRERVYLLGNGERAVRIREAIESRSELGMDLVGVASGSNGHFNGESFAKTLRDLGDRREVDRVIVALADRRSVMPVNELLEIRLRGIRVDDGTSILEKVTGKIEIDELHPSWLIFGDGFRLTQRHWFLRRILSMLS